MNTDLDDTNSAENEWGIYEFLHLVLLEFRGFKSELQSATLNTTQEAPDNKEVVFYLILVILCRSYMTIWSNLSPKPQAMTLLPMKY